MLLTHLSRAPVPTRQPPDPAKRICHGIAARVAGHFGIAAADVISPTRGAPRAAYARQVAMYLARVGFELSFETIGRVFHRDRTTVAHACRVVEDSRDDIGLDRQIAALELTCGESLGGCLREATHVGA